MLSKDAAALLERCAFPTRGTELDCAVSGGADSLALLALARYAGCEVTAYHVDHGLRPSSKDEAAVVAEAADRLGARFVALRIALTPGPNLEARARAARFSALPPDVATGHTADDQAETVLLNLLRGSGRDGLRGMLPGTRHPILRIRRAETRALTKALGLVVVEDPSNADPAYRRNRVRHELVPFLCDIGERDIVPILCRQAGVFADESALLDALAGEIDPTDVRALTGAPLALARRAIRMWLREQTPDSIRPDLAALERILAVARGEAVACELNDGHRLRRSAGRLVLENRTPKGSAGFVKPRERAD